MTDGVPEQPRRARAVSLHDGLAVYRFGSGEPVLLMPGPHRFQRPGLRSADALIEGLVGMGRSAVTFDPPGSGRSTRPPHLGMDEMIACTDEALAALGLGEAVDALGHSMAGLALIAYALERPGRVRRLVLVGTGAGDYLHAAGALWNAGHPGFVAMAALGVAQMVLPLRASEQLLRNFVERRSFVDPAMARPTPVRPADWLHGRTGRTDWHGVARRLDYRPRLPEISTPALILCGRHDPQFALPCSETLHRGIRNSVLRIFERSGHYPFLEEPEAFWNAVRTHLSGVGPAQAAGYSPERSAQP